MEESTEEQLAAAMKAVRHVLRRIAEDPKVACLMGHCTESHDLLCQAVALHEGRTTAEVADLYMPAKQPVAQGAVRTSRWELGEMQASVCETLAVAPFIAAAIITRAERCGRPLPHPRRDPIDAGLDPHFTTSCDRAWVEWAQTAGRRGVRVH